MTRRISFFVIAIVVVFSPRVCPAQTIRDREAKSSPPSGEQILQRFVDVIGGESAYDNIRSIRSKGIISNWDQEQYDFERYFKSPNKELTIEHRSNVEIRRGDDGKVKWRQEGKGKATRVGRSYDLENAVGINEIVHWRTSLNRVRFFGETELFDRKTYVVKVVGVCPATLYFDRQTGLLLRRDFRWEQSLDEVYYSNYVDTAGVKLPRRVVTVDGSTRRRYIATITEMTTNQPLDDGLFAPLTR